VIRHVRLKYACKSCDGTEGPVVTIAPAPEQIIPKSIATPGLLAHIFTTKFVDAVPFYRQEKQFLRLGIELDRASMSSWAMKVSEQCEPLIDMLKKEILSGPLINIDETTVQVMGEENRPNTSKSYMWLFRGGPPGKTGLIFQYHPTRSGEVPKAFLGEYKGCVQTDGYAGYDFIESSDMTHVGCWAHVRRKFFEVTQASKTTGSADVALSYIQKLYAVERSLTNLTHEEIVRTRRDKSAPILSEFKAWLDKRAVQTPPSGLLGKAVHYALGQWRKLVRYTDYGFITPDNNLAENAIRPFVLGRKNWLFSGRPEGANASATLYSLIETAKANNLEPYRYLRHLFENLPQAYTAEEYKTLLPQFVSL
jgi:transposase